MATATRSSVALPEAFSDGDIEFWLRKFELCSAANEWKEDVILKRLPTLLSGKAFAVFERLEEEKKSSFKDLREALVAAFGGDATGKHIAMMTFRNRLRKPDEDIQVFAYNLEALLRRAMPGLGGAERDTLIKQQFIEGVSAALKKELLQQPNLSYSDTVSAAQQLDLAMQMSSEQIGGQVNHATSSRDQLSYQPTVITQMMANMDILTEKVSQLSESVARVNAIPTGNSAGARRDSRGSCFNCGKQGHFARECRIPARGARMDFRQRKTENYCFVCGQVGHFARECQHRFQAPASRQQHQENYQGSSRY